MTLRSSTKYSSIDSITIHQKKLSNSKCQVQLSFLAVTPFFQKNLVWANQIGKNAFALYVPVNC